MNDLIAQGRVVATWGAFGTLLLVGLGAFIGDSTSLGWPCVAAAAGILFRELLHVAEMRALR